VNQPAVLPVQALQIALFDEGAVPVFALHQVMLDGMMLGVGGELKPHSILRADLIHPTFPGPLRTQVRVGWCRPFSAQHFMAGMEFVAPWETLLGWRRVLAPIMGSLVQTPRGPVGFAIRAPREVVLTDLFTIRVAVIALEPGGLLVHRRDGKSETHHDLGFALRFAYAQPEPPILHPPLPGLGAGGPAPAPPPPPAAPAPLVEDEDDDDLSVLPDAPVGVTSEEDALLGMNTMVIGPEKVAVEPEAEVLGMNTVVLPPEETKQELPEELFGMNTVVLPGDAPSQDLFGMNTIVVQDEGASSSRVLKGDSLRARSGGKGSGQSRIMLSGSTVGYATPAGIPKSYSLFDTTGTKIAMLALDDECVRICYMGTKANSDLSFLEAPDGPRALAMALDLDSIPSVEPPLEGLV